VHNRIHAPSLKVVAAAAAAAAAAAVCIFVQWQQAVHHYTSALKCTREPQQEAALLGKRSEALCK
jgi:hypothetical protein